MRTAHAFPDGYRASHLARDAEMLGVLRHAKLVVGCPACANDVRLDLPSGEIRCNACGTVTQLCAHVDGSTDALMRSEPIPPARWNESDEA